MGRKAIGFDWGGVLFVYAFKLYHTVADFLHIPVEEAREVYFRHNHLLNIRECKYQDFWKIIFTELGRAEELDRFLVYIEDLSGGAINQPMFSLVKLLKQRGYKVGLLSNMSSAGAGEIRKHGVEDLFDVVVFSVEEQVMKPDPEIFRIFAGRLGVETKDLIFIDDSVKSLETANTVGYLPILYTDMETLLNRLVNLNVISHEDINSLGIQ